MAVSVCLWEEMMGLVHIWQAKWAAVLLLLLLLAGGQTAHPVVANDHDEEARVIFDAMSIEERIGQLFLVTFEGDTAPQYSDIADLITNYQVGGVVLLAENNNITKPPAQLAALTADLQRLAITGSSSITSTITITDTLLLPDPAPPQNPIPLLIATNYEGDNAPYSEIYARLTAVPSNMAIGATWQPDHARAIGRTIGQDLSDNGINMLIGPVLDVLTHPDPANNNDLGVRAFGGDPYWVGVMGEAYISGVHQGSDNQIAVAGQRQALL
jgi:beta-N-acetylhexosaminidase